MKVILVLALFIAAVAADSCMTTQDCIAHGITACTQQNHVGCHLIPGTNSGICECTTGPIPDTKCVQRSDCNPCARGNAHCIDEYCHCSRH